MEVNLAKVKFSILACTIVALCFCIAPFLTDNGLSLDSRAGTQIKAYLPEHFTFNNGVVTGLAPSHVGATIVDIPDIIDGQAVTNIGIFAFEAKGITSVTLPDGLLVLELGAFDRNQLTSVELPTSLTTIEPFAFGSNLFTSLPEIPLGVTLLQGFPNNLLSGHLVIPSHITTIDNFTINNITSVELPSGLTTIRAGAFSRNQLTSVRIPASVTDIGQNVFVGNVGLTIFAEHANPSPLEQPLGWHEDWRRRDNIGILEHPVAWGASTVGIINFISQGGNFVVPVAEDPGYDFQLPSTTRPGFNFLGWSVNANATTGEFAAGYEWTITSDQRLYAIWSNPIEFTITFNNIQGAKHANPNTFTVETPRIDLASATRSGYTFAGWWTQATGGEQVHFIQQGTVQNQVLYARWTQDESTSNLTLILIVVGGVLLLGLAAVFVAIKVRRT